MKSESDIRWADRPTVSLGYDWYEALGFKCWNRISDLIKFRQRVRFCKVNRNNKLMVKYLRFYWFIFSLFSILVQLVFFVLTILILMWIKHYNIILLFVVTRMTCTNNTDMIYLITLITYIISPESVLKATITKFEDTAVSMIWYLSVV